jgi:hypothetical protein
MPDLLINFACPLIVSAAFVYAGTVNVRHRWRQQRGLPLRHRTPLTDARRRLMEEIEADKRAREQARKDAEWIETQAGQVLADADERFASLYEQPTSEHADN